MLTELAVPDSPGANGSEADQGRMVEVKSTIISLASGDGDDR
jgi:hypothetical protein